MIEALDRGVECAARGESTDVQFVDHRARQRTAPPASIGPVESGVVVALTRTGRSGWLPRRAGIRQQVAAVQPEPVTRIWSRVGIRDGPPATGGRGHLVHGCPQISAVTCLAAGRPHPELGHAVAAASSSPCTSSATGSSAVTSASLSRLRRAPVARNSAPVSRSCQRPAGTASTVSRQPPDRRRPPGSLVATVTAWPARQNATTCEAAEPLTCNGR